MTRRDPAAADAIARLMAALASVPAAAGDRGDFTHHEAHRLPAAAIERMDAVCVECGAVTAGIWQHARGGNRLRTPTEHEDTRGDLCPGSFAAAELRARSTTGETRR